VRPVEEHLAECLAAVEPLPPLDLALLDAVDCVLAEDVVAEVDLPPGAHLVEHLLEVLGDRDHDDGAPCAV